MTAEEAAVLKLQEAWKLIEDPADWSSHGAGQWDAEGKCRTTRCIATALIDSAPSALGDHAAWSALYTAVPGQYMSMAEYNDLSSTTHNDVRQLFEKAIASLLPE